MSSSGGSDGAYTTDEELIIRVVFTEGGVRGSVTGPPRVTLNFDGGTRVAKWDPSLIFNPTQYPLVRFFSYVVQEGDLASEGPTISANAINLAGGFIRDEAGNDADTRFIVDAVATLTHVASSADTRFIVDAVAPTVSSIAITSDPDDTYGTGDKIEVTVTFSENMSIPTSITCSSDVVHCKAELELDIGGTARTADYQSHDGAEVVYACTVQAGDTDDNGIAIGANKLTGQRIMDATGKFGYAINDADLSHDAVADNAGHKVATLGEPPKSTDATLKWLKLSGIDIGGGLDRGAYAQNQTSFKANVYHSVSQTTVTPTVNHSAASYVIELGGVEDADGAISLAVGSNVITVEVTAEDDSTTQTYTVTVNRATASAPTTGELSTDDPPVNYRAIYVSKTFAGFALSFPRNRGLFGWVGQRYEHDGDSFVSSGADSRYEDSDSDDFGGSRLEFSDENVEPGALYKWVAMLKNSQGSTVIETSVTVRIPPDETTESSDATLSDLTLTGMELEKTGGLHAVVEGFRSTHLSYAASVANSVSQTTVSPTVNHSGASYVIKLNSVTDEDGVISLSVGNNIITIEVTAEDGETTRTYTVAVTRAAALSTDATLRSLTLSGVDFGTFDSTTVSYTAQVANSVSQTTVTPTVNHSGASYVIKLGGVTDADGVVALSVGSNTITIEVTAEDDSTTRTYTVTVTRAELPSTDATLRSLTLSGVDFGTFDSTTVSYTAQVANSVSQTTVTPTVNHSGALHVIKLGGVTDADGVVSLSVGSNVITVEVTAEDDSTTRTYTVTVTRAASSTPEQLSSDAKLSALTLSGIDFGTFDSTTTSYTARVANSVTGTTVIPTVNHSGASYAIKLGGVMDADGVVSLNMGNNVITVDVTAEDGNTAQTYTITVTRAAPPSTDATLSSLSMTGIDFGTFAPATASYTAQVADSVSHTTVTPTVNHPGAGYVIKLGGTTDADGVIALAVGSNVITVEVTAQDGETTRTYTVTVTRAEPSSTDATLSSLTLSGIDFGTFDSTTSSYTAQVANDVTKTTVTPTVNHSGASYVIKLGGVTDEDGAISLSVGDNVITVEVTAEDGITTQTYTVTVTVTRDVSNLRGPSLCVSSGAVTDQTNTGLVSDCDALLQAKDKLEGIGATRTLNWSAGTPMTNWYGVVLSGTPERVAQLRLHGQNANADTGTAEAKLNGTIPAELGQLSELTVLYLHRNTLTGEIPAELGNLANLEWLSLYDNDLTGAIPTELADLSNLERLYLNHNDLTGQIPGDLGKMSSLTHLFLRHNQLTGPIPAELGGLTNLEWLSLWGNELTGEIPTELGNLANLRELNLHVNQLTGEIPAELGGLSNLQSLILGGNELTGEIPVWLGSLANLEVLHLGWNQLTGPIPAELGSLANLQSLELGGNQLTGPIPAELGSLANLRSLGLSENQLTGEIPSELGNLANLQSLELGGNQLIGPIPAELGSLTNLQWLALDGNQLTGKVPSELGSLANLQSLSLWGNEFTGKIPSELDSLANLQSLDLSSNQLAGPIPAELGSLANLEWLNLSYNQLTGKIPSELGNLTNLRSLGLSENQLTGEIPSELGNLANLQSLDLSSNQLAGPIPAELGSLSNLQSLNLSYNQLTGKIPSELGNLTNLQSLGLSENQLTGEIPSELGNLANLEWLYLSHNQLTGNIPSELGNLSNLETLYLSQNQLTGCIPARLRDVPDNDLANLSLPFCAAPQDACVIGGAATDAANTGLVSDCETLLEAKDKLEGTGATRTLNWSADTPMANWYGVVLSGTPQRVTYLRLHGQNEDAETGTVEAKLNGTIPAELGQLSELTVLYNQTGEVPGALGNLANLEWLSLYDNDLTGAIPTELADLSNLERLYLNHNDLTGQIPGDLGEMSSLTHLFLHRNQLTGTIPADEWDGLDNLEWLSLYGNDLTGGIPTDLTGLSKLERLYLHENRNLGGTIPAELGQMSSLTHLLLLRTGLTGEIPDSLGELSNLEWLSLYDNELMGEIPRVLGGLTKLQRLYLHYNMLSGEIPAELGNLSTLTNLWLNDNELTGEIPNDLDNLTNLVRWRLRNNNLTGCVPAGIAAVTNNDLASLGLPTCSSP